MLRESVAKLAALTAIVLLVSYICFAWIVHSKQQAKKQLVQYRLGQLVFASQELWESEKHLHSTQSQTFNNNSYFSRLIPFLHDIPSWWFWYHPELAWDDKENVPLAMFLDSSFISNVNVATHAEQGFALSHFGYNSKVFVGGLDDLDSGQKKEWLFVERLEVFSPRASPCSAPEDQIHAYLEGSGRGNQFRNIAFADGSVRYSPVEYLPQSQSEYEACLPGMFTSFDKTSKWTQQAEKSPSGSQEIVCDVVYDPAGLACVVVFRNTPEGRNLRTLREVLSSNRSVRYIYTHAVLDGDSLRWVGSHTKPIVLAVGGLTDSGVDAIVRWEVTEPTVLRIRSLSEHLHEPIKRSQSKLLDVRFL